MTIRRLWEAEIVVAGCGLQDVCTAGHMKALTWDRGGKIVDHILVFKDLRCSSPGENTPASSRLGHRELA